jgi:hypothetical protein
VFGPSPKGGCQMRPPTERDQCQTKLAVLIEGFMRADWTACRDAAAWLRDFADQENIERGRVMCGRYWFTPQQTKVMRRECRSNTRAWVRFGLSALGALSFGQV